MRSDAIPQGRLYAELAHLMPVITPPGDYAEEAAFWRTVLRDSAVPPGAGVLELGVGAGHNLSHLAGEFRATGVDLSEAMLELCRALNPGWSCTGATCAAGAWGGASRRCSSTTP
jgi:SAM-dependent methyltransferase